MKTIRIGTRKSPLALYQAKQVAKSIERTCNYKTQLICFNTQGDKNQNQCLTEIGGKGVFTEEIEFSLQNKSIDIAVHSLKDLPVPLESCFNILAVLPREDPRDAFLSHSYSSFTELPDGAVIGTSSIRRRAFLKMLKPSLKFVSLRGNIETRYKKTCTDVFHGSIMAYAACKRLDMISCCRSVFSLDEMLPAPGQGIIAIESSKNNSDLDIKNYINDPTTYISAMSERRVLQLLEGGCQTPIGALCTIHGNEMQLSIKVVHPDGKTHCFCRNSGQKEQWEKITEEAVNKILLKGAKEIITEACL